MLIRKIHPNSVSYSVPVNSWLRTQLDKVEQFVQENIDVESLPSRPKKADFIYKPLWRGERMFIGVSPCCSFLRFNSLTHGYDMVDRESMQGKGTYNITVEAPYVFIGPHKNGQNYSLSLDIVQMAFYPAAEAEPEPEPVAPKKSKRGRPRTTSVSAAELSTKTKV